MKKTIVYDSDARSGLIAGAEKIAKAVRITLGPSGKNVLIRKKGERAPFATKDGVTVAKEVFSENYIEQQAIEALQEVASNADNSAGDGTTTATILAEAILKKGSLLSKETTNFLDLKRGIDIGVHEVVDRLKKLAKPCDDLKELREVALISSNNDIEIAKIVTDAFEVAGKQGVVNIKRSRTQETYLTTIEGMNLPTGYHSNYFITDAGDDLVDLDKPYVYMTNQKITSVSENLRNLLGIISINQHSLLIICKGIDPSVLGMLVQNKLDGDLKVCVCIAPGFGEEQNNILKDLGVMLGKDPFIENENIDFNHDIIVGTEEVVMDGKTQVVPKASDMLSYLPQSESVLVTKDRMSVKGPIGLDEKQYKDIEETKRNRADKLRDSLDKHVSTYEQMIIQTRISRLTDGIAYINIGAITEIEYTEKQARIQDALYAVKSASEEGIIPGGGTALLYVSQTPLHAKSPSVQAGINVVLKSIQEPFKQILKNVGIKLEDGELDNIKNNFNRGIDARTGEYNSDMIAHGIIDPVKVTRVALENAASVAGMLLTTDCVIIENEVYEKPLHQQNY